MGFTFVSGHRALDFAGTLQHRRADRRELLTEPADLARWATEAGLLTTEPAAGTADLEAALALREAIYRLAAGTGTAADRDLLNHHAAAPPVTPRLTPRHTLERTGDLDAVLADLARGAAELLGGPAAAQIRECQADPCTRLYLDTSRRGSRRWCDMRECGNRAKAAAFRARHRP